MRDYTTKQVGEARGSSLYEGRTEIYSDTSIFIAALVMVILTYLSQFSRLAMIWEGESSLWKRLERKGKTGASAHTH